jgi:DNA uptake protein ComE-like DNA-binding protein
MAYYYKGLEAQLIPNQIFNTHWNVLVMIEGRQVVRCAQPGVDLFEKQGDATIPLPQETKADILPLLPTQAPQSMQLQAEEKVNINSATFSLIRKAMPGLGRVGAKKLVDNRPAEGYQNFEQLKEINAELQTNWSVVEAAITF